MRFRSLGSGSSGNATVVEADTGRGSRPSYLLVDCGLGIRQLQTRLARADLGFADIDAIFITHEHADHIGSAFAVAATHHIPLWMSRGTHAALLAASRAPDLGSLLHYASDAVPFAVGDIEVTPFTVPHDAREPLQLTCSDGQSRLGILTDLGHASSHVLEHLQGCNALLLECNHDPELLANGRYPPFLKARVGGRLGHLANEQAADIARALVHPRLGPVVAAHLSEHNNRPDLALAALALALGRRAADMLAASAAHGTPWVNVSSGACETGVSQ